MDDINVALEDQAYSILLEIGGAYSVLRNSGIFLTTSLFTFRKLCKE
jgi:hypothetical protein